MSKNVGADLPNSKFAIVYGGKVTVKRRKKTAEGTDKQVLQINALFRVRRHIAEVLELNFGDPAALAPKIEGERLTANSASKHGKTVIVPDPRSTTASANIKTKYFRFQVPSYMNRAHIYNMLVSSKAEMFRFPGGNWVPTPNAKPGGK